MKQNAVRFPVWQFQDGQLLPGMREVLAVLAKGDHVDDWGRILFFMNPRHSLNKKRPLDLLREGNTVPVLRLAQSYISD